MKTAWSFGLIWMTGRGCDSTVLQTWLNKRQRQPVNMGYGSHHGESLRWFVMDQYHYGAKAYAPSLQAISNGHMRLRSQGTWEPEPIWKYFEKNRKNGLTSVRDFGIITKLTAEAVRKQIAFCRMKSLFIKKLEKFRKKWLTNLERCDILDKSSRKRQQNMNLDN